MNPTDRGTQEAAPAQPATRAQCSEFALHATDLDIEFEGNPVLTLPEVRVARGETLGLVGLSGAGKTSCLRAISGDLPTTPGSVLIDGIERSDAERQRLVSRTIQSFPLLHWLPVRKCVLLAARLRQAGHVDVESLLERFHAAHLAHRLPQRLSGGERCRVSLAMATLGNPRVLLLDEPFSGLDSLVKHEIAMALLNSAREFECGVVLVTHDLHDAAEYCDRAIVLRGRNPARIAGRVLCKTPTAATQIMELMTQDALQ